MKRIVAITLLIIYVSAAVQQLLPWISDVAAHTFNWHDHLETVHHGEVHSHHVSHEIAALSHEDDAQHTSTHTFLFDKDALSAHLLPLATLALPTVSPFLSSLPGSLQFFYRSIAQRIFLPPPNRLLTCF